MKKVLYILLFLPLFAIAQEQDPCFSVIDFISYTEEANPTITKNFVGGWNMFGFPCSQEIDIVEAFSSIIDKVLLVKTNNGSVYMPEYGFNGIGLLVGGEGYQIKMANTVYDFSFCETITWATIEGCTDCEASNFNQWASINDGTCNYDSDGDGVNDEDEVLGCQNVIACNYHPEATEDDESCEYSETNYDCEGSLTAVIGDTIAGGYLFYLDETGQHGLVAAMVDIEGTYEWGCDYTFIGAGGTSIGEGLQNTLDIVLGCSDTPIAASAALDFENEGYTDWYLPSRDELIEVYNTIGNGAIQVVTECTSNIGGFGNSWYWSSSEVNNNWANNVSFYNGDTNQFYNKYSNFKVRAIRNF